MQMRTAFIGIGLHTVTVYVSAESKREADRQINAHGCGMTCNNHLCVVVCTQIFLGLSIAYFWPNSVSYSSKLILLKLLSNLHYIYYYV